MKITIRFGLTTDADVTMQRFNNMHLDSTICQAYLDNPNTVRVEVFGMPLAIYVLSVYCEQLLSNVGNVESVVLESL